MSSNRQSWFTTTHWSVVVAAGDTKTQARNDALEQLCRDYWYPLYAYVRRRGYNPLDAEDLTQGFFERLLRGRALSDANPAKGRFRSFLLGALKHFLSDERDRAQALKRGGNRTVISWDAELAEGRYGLELGEGQRPDALYEKSWALMILERVVERIRLEYVASGKGDLFNDLKQFFWSDLEETTYADLAPRLGMTEAALKMTTTRLRRRCREVLRSAVAETVANAKEIEDEVKHLLSVLRG